MKKKTLLCVVGTILLSICGQHAKADTSFDGLWSVTMDSKSFQNPNGSKAQAFVWKFPARVKNGMFHGERGTRGKPGWYELNGQIAGGAAILRADEITGESIYNYTLSQKAPPGSGMHYSYQVEAHFETHRGAGHSTDARTRLFTFVRNG